MQLPPELLGSFYLGAEYDLKNGRITETAVNYDARDLTTHAIGVGMTGSGKTGLCIGLLEEAAMDKVPAILIDPKGDMTNLLLQFPELRPEDFEPWINLDDAQRAGASVQEHAQTVAETWRGGLAQWGMSQERIRLLQASAEFAIYTPGSNAGIPISLLGSLAAPGLDFDEHAEVIRERIGGTVAALLSLVGIEADALRSREAILLSTIFEHAWRQNQNLDLAKLIASIQSPPVRQMGVIDVDTFYPQKERFDLAMAFNNLVAAPSFQSWLEGEPLDVDRLFYTSEGKPRHSVFYIAHLSEAERMFFVTLLLESVLTWVRRQTGTTSLRALLYFDEVFGFFPPIAEPPSKRPLLTLLKQARAVGLGCMLVTQNPADLDYKGLTNAGTWFIGKLQAERDKERVLQGLRGAISQAGGSEKVDYDALVNQLGNRLFLMHNVHAERPIVLHTRWAMSYLRGPLTRAQVRTLMGARKQKIPEGGARISEPLDLQAPLSSPSPPGFLPTPPALDPSVPQAFVPVSLSEQAAIRQLAQELGREPLVESVQLVYEPAIVGGALVRFVDRKCAVNEQVESVLLAPAPGDASAGSGRGWGSVDWGAAETLPLRLDDLAAGPEQAGADRAPFFAAAPQAADSAPELKRIARDLAEWLYYNSRLALAAHAGLGLVQRPGEKERDFKIRVQQAARERRDAEVDALELKYAARIEKLEAQLRKRERQLAASEAEYAARKHERTITVGETAINFFLGRRHTRAMSIIASKQRLAEKAELDIEETQQEIAELEEEKTALENELKTAADEITRKWADLLDDLTVEEFHPRRTDVDVRVAALGWLPSWWVSYRVQGGARALMATIAAYPLPESAP